MLSSKQVAPILLVLLLFVAMIFGSARLVHAITGSETQTWTVSEINMHTEKIVTGSYIGDISIHIDFTNLTITPENGFADFYIYGGMGYFSTEFRLQYVSPGFYDFTFWTMGSNSGWVNYASYGEPSGNVTVDINVTSSYTACWVDGVLFVNGTDVTTASWGSPTAVTSSPSQGLNATGTASVTISGTPAPQPTPSAPPSPTPSPTPSNPPYQTHAVPYTAITGENIADWWNVTVGSDYEVVITNRMTVSSGDHYLTVDAQDSDGFGIWSIDFQNGTYLDQIQGTHYQYDNLDSNGTIVLIVQGSTITFVTDHGSEQGTIEGGYPVLIRTLNGDGAFNGGELDITVTSYPPSGSPPPSPSPTHGHGGGGYTNTFTPSPSSSPASSLATTVPSFKLTESQVEMVVFVAVAVVVVVSALMLKNRK